MANKDPRGTTGLNAVFHKLIDASPGLAPWERAQAHEAVDKHVDLTDDEKEVAQQLAEAAAERAPVDPKDRRIADLEAQLAEARG